MAVIERGAIYAATVGGVERRICVLSIDEHNAGPYTGAILIAPLARKNAPFGIACGATDGISGYIRVAEMMPLATPRLGQYICLLSGPTLAQLDRAIMDYTGIPT